MKRISVDEEVFKKSFEKTGFFITADSSKDGKIRLQDLEEYDF